MREKKTTSQSVALVAFVFFLGTGNSSTNKNAKGLFGSVAIHWMTGDIHFFSGYPVFG
jgi:hypothetical protein